jgi:hypothetical protein
MIVNYKDTKIEILKTGDVQIDKDYVEIWIDRTQIANFEKDGEEIKVEFYYKKNKIFGLPIEVLKKAIKAAEEFIED